MDPSPTRGVEYEPGSSATKELAEKALQANIAHQHALTRYAKQLEAELQELDGLIGAVNSPDDGDGDLEPEIQIPGAKKPEGPCPSAEFLNPKSPFFEAASRRANFIDNTTLHPMKASELDALAEAVRNENQRLQAYALHRRGQGVMLDAQIDLDNNTEGLDWGVIAEKVSSVSSVKRTADQCRIKWLGDRHPKINHGEWTQPESVRLKEIVESQRASGEGKIDWVRVANDLGTNRTPIDCMRHGIPRQRHKWNQPSDKKLLDAVKKYGNNSWNVVARFVSEDVTTPQCQIRYSRLDPALKRGKWSKEEDSRLELAFKAYGNSWVEVAACIAGRTNEQCRERWSEISSSRAPWTQEEEKSLLEAVSTLGNAWTKIAEKLGNGRTGQQCRLRHDKLKKLQALRLPAAADPSVPGDGAAEPSEPTDRDGAPPAKNKRRHGAPNRSKESGLSGNTQTAPVAPKARPKPRPLGKGKVKITEPEAQPDQSSAERAISDQADSVTGDPPTAAVSTKRKSSTKEPENQAPAPKKRKSTKPKSDNPSGAMGAGGTSVAPLIRRGGPVRKSARMKSSPRKNVGQSTTPVIPSSEDLGDSNRIDHGEAEPEAGSSSLATEVPRPPPRPRERPKATPRLPPAFTDVHSLTDAEAGQNAAERAGDSTNASTSKRLQAVRMEETLAQDRSGSGDGGEMNTSSLQSRSTETMELTEASPTAEPNITASSKTRRRARIIMGSNAPRRQSARVAARDTPATGAPCGSETAQSELRSNDTVPAD